MRILAPMFVPGGEIAEEVDEEAAGLGFYKIMAWAPQIGEMEQNPDEIATFQSRALGDLFEMGEEEVDALHPILASHFAKIAAAELTPSSQPPEDDAEGRELWQQGRGEALQDLMRDLRPTLPGTMTMAQKKAFSAVLNLGMGAHEERGNVGIRPWPEVPW